MAETPRQAVITSCDANWIPAAAVALLSIARHGLPPATDLIIFAHQPTEADHESLGRFNMGNKTTIQLHQIDLGPDPGFEFREWGIGAALMLALDRFLDHGYRRVLHIDVDTLAMRPVAPLLATDLEGKLLGAVDEAFWLYSARRLAQYQRDGEVPYFNSGVLLFDWPAAVADGLLPRALALLGNGTRWPLVDQDVLNAAATGKWHALDLRWNWTTWLDSFRHESPFIRHFTTRTKPWTRGGLYADRRYHAVYVEALAGTGWESFVSEKPGRWRLKVALRELRHRLEGTHQRRLTEALERPAAQDSA